MSNLGVKLKAAWDMLSSPSPLIITKFLGTGKDRKRSSLIFFEESTFRKWREHRTEDRRTAAREPRAQRSLARTLLLTQLAKLCRSHAVTLSGIVKKKKKKNSQRWVLKLFLENKNRICHCTFSKLGLYFGGFLLGLASILDGEDHVAHQIEDLLTRHLEEMRPEGTNCKFLTEATSP